MPFTTYTTGLKHDNQPEREPPTAKYEDGKKSKDSDGEKHT